MGLLTEIKLWVRRKKLARRRPADTFARYYRTNKWGDKHSRSGKGSNLSATENLRKVLPALLDELEVYSFLDCPCGDFFWMRHVDLAGRRYTGGDIVPELIESNREAYASDTVSFEVIDLITDSIPKHDLVFVRDCLVHLSNAHLAAALENIKVSGSTWLLTTTYPDTEVNADISTGEWRPINLTKPPFNLPPPDRLIAEGCDTEKGQRPDKHLGLWRIERIATSVPNT